MSENKHTPEPWRIGSLDSYDGYTGQPFRNVWAGEGDDATVVARAMRTKGAMKNDVDADASRIVACVNACAGSQTDALEEMQRRGLTFGQLAFIHARLQQQRDELLAENEQLRKDAERYRVLRDSKYQLDEDDPIVSDSFFNEYFGKELDSAVDELKSRFDSAIASVKGEQP